MLRVDGLVENEKMEPNDAYKIALAERQWAEDSIKIERQVAKVQAETLFQIKPIDHFEDQHFNDPTAQLDRRDPRVIETIERARSKKLAELIQSRRDNPLLPKLTRAETGLSHLQMIEYLQKYPEHREVFDESVYWGNTEDKEEDETVASLATSSDVKPRDDEDHSQDEYVIPVPPAFDTSEKERSKLK